MRFAIIIAICIGLLGCGQQQSAPSSNEWVRLFNQEDLDGWIPRIIGQEVGVNYANTFRVDSGILKIRYDGYGDFNNQFGALYTDKSYHNYRLKAEYRFVGDTATGAPVWGFRDSGIMYHTQSPESLNPDQPFPICLEYNLHGGDGTNDRPNGQICLPGTTVELDGERSTSFCNDPQVRRTFHGDQWVTLEIEVRDSVISHYANGEKILTYKDPRYDPDNDIAAALMVDGDAGLRSGRIAIQSNSHPIDFRSIEIKELD